MESRPVTMTKRADMSPFSKCTGRSVGREIGRLRPSYAIALAFGSLRASKSRRTTIRSTLSGGRARELLDCDVLRIIGCNLGPNDWDLVSLLFSTRHTHVSAAPYSIEVISAFETADRIRELFPYLDVRWLPQLPKIGDQIVGELLGSQPRRFDNLSEKLQLQATQKAQHAIANPFSYWLTLKGEALLTEVGDMSTESGVFRDFTDEMA